MHHDYRDIIDEIERPPVWWDEYAAPRYCEFSPEVNANIYADEVLLLRIECQECRHAFDVCISRTKYQTMESARALAAIVKDGDIHYGDPPNYCGCCAGATMNSIPIRVLQFWKRDFSQGFNWVRDESLEVDAWPDWMPTEDKASE